jgi:hypothetical protein
LIRSVKIETIVRDVPMNVVSYVKDQGGVTAYRGETPPAEPRHVSIQAALVDPQERRFAPFVSAAVAAQPVESAPPTLAVIGGRSEASMLRDARRELGTWEQKFGLVIDAVELGHIRATLASFDRRLSAIKGEVTERPEALRRGLH